MAFRNSSGLLHLIGPSSVVATDVSVESAEAAGDIGWRVRKRRERRSPKAAAELKHVRALAKPSRGAAAELKHARAIPKASREVAAELRHVRNPT